MPKRSYQLSLRDLCDSESYYERTIEAESELDRSGTANADYLKHLKGTLVETRRRMDEGEYRCADPYNDGDVSQPKICIGDFMLVTSPVFGLGTVTRFNSSLELYLVKMADGKLIYATADNLKHTERKLGGEIV